MFFNRKKENLRKFSLKIQTKTEIEKCKKYIKKMSSLRNEISFEHKELVPEFDSNNYKNYNLDGDGVKKKKMKVKIMKIYIKKFIY